MFGEPAMVNRSLFDFQRRLHDAIRALSGRRRVRETGAFGQRGRSCETTRVGTAPGPDVLAPENPDQRRAIQVMALLPTVGKRHEGLAHREAVSATWEGKPLKGKPQRRYRHETGPEGFREERSVKRLRKPEGAAQPGEASLVWVASRCLKRHRGTNLMRGVASATVHRGHTLQWSPSP